MQKYGFNLGLLISLAIHASFFGFFYFESLQAKPQEIKPTPITLSLFEEEKQATPQPQMQQPKKEPKKIVQKQKQQEIKPIPQVKQTEETIPVKTVQATPPPIAQQDTPKPKSQPVQAKTETDEIKKYLSKVRKILQENLEYPYYAKKAGIEGVTIVYFCLKKDGSMPIHSLRITKSSGHALLDRHALETVQNSAPFPAPPSGELEVTIPIAFSIKS